MSFEMIPFLSLNGQAAQAIEFYEKTLGAKVLFRKTYQEMKEMDPAFSFESGQEEYITHSVLQIGANKVMIAEEPMDPREPWRLGSHFSFCIQSKDTDVIERLYESLAGHEQVTIISKLEANAFGPAYAVVRDPFGVVIQLCVTRHDF